MPSMNEYFAENMMGKTVKYDVQPYSRGTGTIKSIGVRRIKASQWLMPYGRTNVEYEVFDLTLDVIEGSSTGALSAGVPVPGTVHSTNGKTESVTGVTYSDLYEAAEKGKTIVIARCG
jgi:hypothetical protein